MTQLENKSTHKIERQTTTKMRLCADQTPNCKQIELNENEDAQELRHKTLCAPLPNCGNNYNRDDQKTMKLNADHVVNVDAHEIQDMKSQHNKNSNRRLAWMHLR